MVSEYSVMTEGFLLLDCRGGVKYCSGAASAVLGLFPEEVVGQVLPELLLNRLSRVVSPEGLNALVELVSAQHGGAATVEITCSERKRQEYVFTVFPLSPTLEGVMTGLTIHDATVERATQRRKDAFIAVLSHELRDPITALMGFTRLLMEAGTLNGAQRQWLENIETCGQRLTAITYDMLDVVGIRTGNLTVDLRPEDLRPVIDEVLPVTRETYGALNCSVDIPPGLPAVIADRTRLAQVLGNLLSNAVKYSARGSRVCISAHHDPERRRVVVAVADRGLGIAPQEMSNIFAPFHRSRRPEANEVKGAGLGLYIVKGLVELMDGEVWVESEIDRGSTFYVALPAAAKAPSPRQRTE